MHWQILDILWEEMHKVHVTFLSLYGWATVQYSFCYCTVNANLCFACTTHCWNYFLKARWIVCVLLFPRLQKKVASALYFYTVSEFWCCFFWPLQWSLLQCSCCSCSLDFQVIQTRSAVCSVHSALLCKINRCVYFYISVYTSVRGDGTLSFMSEIVHPWSGNVSGSYVTISFQMHAMYKTPN